MSSTRTAQTPGPMRQERFASSAGFSKGLLGNLVARRCARVNSVTARERIYFLHEVSSREPGLRHPSCTSFPAWPWDSTNAKDESAFERIARELCHARGIPAAVADTIPDFLTRLCLDPKMPADSATLAGFPAILAALDGYRRKFEHATAARVAMTATTRAVWDLLDYAMSQRGLVLAEGPYRTGKTYSAQAWAQMHLGQSRYVQLSSAKDEGSFYRDIARAVGVACSTQMKAAEMRNRIEAVLREQHLLLVMDEADFIWPQAVNVKQVPDRVCWMLTSLINNGVPVALIGSRNFSRLMSNCERRCKVWGSEQFHGRLRLRTPLPAQLGEADLFAIARAVVPEADDASRMLIVGHALKSAVPIPAIEACAARARYFASEAGRALTFEDVERAMMEAGTLQATHTESAPPPRSSAPSTPRQSTPRPVTIPGRAVRGPLAGRPRASRATAAEHHTPAIVGPIGPIQIFPLSTPHARGHSAPPS
jgi:hypothetical protein